MCADAVQQHVPAARHAQTLAQVLAICRACARPLEDQSLQFQQAIAGGWVSVKHQTVRRLIVEGIGQGIGQAQGVASRTASTTDRKPLR